MVGAIHLTSKLDLQIRRAQDMMLEGAKLGHKIPGRFGWQLRTMINGGLLIAHYLDYIRKSVFRGHA